VKINVVLLRTLITLLLNTLELFGFPIFWIIIAMRDRWCFFSKQHLLWPNPLSPPSLTSVHKPSYVRHVAFIYLLFAINEILFTKEKFEDTTCVIRIRKSKKNRQYNGKKWKYKRTQNDPQSIQIKLMIE
jgi:hypothetical protein